MVDQACPIVGRSRFAKHDPDPLGTGIDDPFNIGTTERRAVLLAPELCDHHIGDLVDELFVISVCGHRVGKPDFIIFGIASRRNRSWPHDAYGVPRSVWWWQRRVRSLSPRPTNSGRCRALKHSLRYAPGSFSRAQANNTRR